MQKEKAPIRLYFLLIAVMASWGFNVTMTKILVSYFPTVTMTSFRIFTAAITVIFILIITKKLRLPTRRELGYIILASIFNIVLHHFFLSNGLRMTSGTNAGLILGSAPIIVALFSVIFLRERIGIARAIGFLAGIFGVSLVVLSSGAGISGISTGDIYVFIAMASQAFSFIIIKKLAGSMDTGLMTGYMLFIGSIMLFGLSRLMEPNGISQLVAVDSWKLWLLFIVSAVVATAFGNFVYNYAVGKIGPSRSAIFMNFNPLFSLIGALLFLGESIKALQLIGFIFIIIGVLLGSGALMDIILERKKSKIRNPEKLLSE
ncbi:DMT family transporter [Listeria sp. FSL L7-1517]|uniref:DMT family transporter n=1 Tax=Listeria immobilis TaxID=2713502 RepID=UPI00164EB0BF|nr:DMT family transporter [Listeria immobilis]MBC6296188.1 DMT family transporter [Listeria immobilis]